MKCGYSILEVCFWDTSSRESQPENAWTHICTCNGFAWIDSSAHIHIHSHFEIGRTANSKERTANVNGLFELYIFGKPFTSPSHRSGWIQFAYCPFVTFLRTSATFSRSSAIPIHIFSYFPTAINFSIKRLCSLLCLRTTLLIYYLLSTSYRFLAINIFLSWFKYFSRIHNKLYTLRPSP